jgi:alpha/beta superfamily hydrolase
MHKIRENEFFAGEKPLFITHYAGKADRYLVILPPLFEELPRTRKLMVNTARFLAGCGMDVIRFDYYGTGLSYGRFEDFSLEQARNDIQTVTDYCRQRGAQGVSLLGFRFGAFLAGELCANSNIAKTVLWEPILHLGEYLEECFKALMVDQIVTYGTMKFTQKELMEHLRRDGKLLVNGYPLSLKAAEEFRSARVLGREDLRRTGIILWRRSTLNKYPFLSELDSMVCASVKAAWDHIKFMDHDPKELLEATGKFLTSSGFALQGTVP